MNDTADEMYLSGAYMIATQKRFHWVSLQKEFLRLKREKASQTEGVAYAKVQRSTRNSSVLRKVWTDR